MNEKLQAMRVAPIRPLLIKIATPNAVALLIQSFASMAEVAGLTPSNNTRRTLHCKPCMGQCGGG
jgi:hypothetical protein